MAWNKERLAEVLILLQRKFGDDVSEEGLLATKLTREELSTYVGTATETVIRLISDFKDQGLIESKGKQIKILNREGLLSEAGLED